MKDTSERMIDAYVNQLLEATGMHELPEDEKAVWSHRVAEAMHKAITIELISSLSPEGKKRFEGYLSEKDLGNALKVLVEENAYYEEKMKTVLETYKKNFLERYREELGKQ